MGRRGEKELEGRYRGGDKSSKNQQPKSNQTPDTRTGEEENKVEKEEKERGKKR